MFLRFFIFIFCITLSNKANAITADDISMQIEPYSYVANPTGTLVNNFTVKLNLPNGWYTYYKNGGDTGKGPALSFNNMPKEISSKIVAYQTPNKHEDYGFVSYIYTNTAKFNFNLLRTGDSKQALKHNNLNLNGNFSFLVCKNICVPINKEFSIKQKVDNNFKENINFFKITNSFMPTEKSEFIIKNGFIYIKLQSKNIKQALFIPNTEGLIDDSAEQSIIKKENYTFLKVKVDEYLEQYPTSITGVIKTDANSYNIKISAANINLTSSYETIANLLIVALFALLGGIILNLMPCVLPVIGLKVFALLKHTSLKERLSGALSYSAGVFVSMMAIVAVLVTLKSLGHELAWGFQLQNKYFIYFMISILMVVGLNLLGIFEFGNGISNKANKFNMKHSGDFFTGILTTLVATPCTAPFMATSLGFALTADSNLITFTIFAFLALGIALPILIIAIIPKANKLLPKPGSWTERLKQFLAFPIFATVIWLVWVLDSGNYIVTLCISGVFIASFIGWNLTLTSKIKHLNIIVILTLSIFAIFNHINKPEKALQFSKQEIYTLNKSGKNVFVDFTAKWCLTCQYNKKSVLDLTETRRILTNSNTEFMIADWTNKDDTITKELELLGRSGVPVYAIYPADGATPILLPEILTLETLKEYLERL